eukprot:2121801-Pleurochrysis_carterae.AAC.5
MGNSSVVPDQAALCSTGPKTHRRRPTLRAVLQVRGRGARAWRCAARNSACTHAVCACCFSFSAGSRDGSASTLE